MTRDGQDWAYRVGMGIGVVLGVALRLLGARPAAVRNWSEPRAAKWDAVANPDHAAGWDVSALPQTDPPGPPLMSGERVMLEYWTGGALTPWGQLPEHPMCKCGPEADQLGPAANEDRLIELRATWQGRDRDER